MKYSELVKIYEELGKTTKRLEKIDILSKFLKDISEEDAQVVVYMLQGKVFPPWSEKKIGMSSRLILKVIANSSGISQEKVESSWKKTGDLGKTAEEIIKAKKQATLYSTTLTVKKIFENIKKLAEMKGKGTVDKKIKLISELLTSAKPNEAKYIVNTILETLRVGVADGTIRDAIAKAFNIEVEKIQHAYDVSNDFSQVLISAKKGKLSDLKVSLAKPLKCMLALKEDTIEEAFERTGKPAQLEQKYDGFRLQIHKHNNEISLFTRRLENVTKQFAELVPIIKSHIKGEEFILDSECVGYDPKTKKYLPFQNVSQRIRRKYDIEKIAEKIPVEINVFDIMFYNGKSMLNEQFKERRELIEKIIKSEKYKIVPAKKLVTSSEKDAEKFFKESLELGNEGLMFKKMDAPYKPGARVGYMIKYKNVMETLDLVITKATYGEGKRASWLSSFTLSCKKEDSFVEIGKVGTGIKEKEGLTFKQLTKILKPLIEKETGKTVILRPKIVVEIAYEEIQKSVNYNSGYALRFPRVIKIRNDLSAKGCNDIKKVEQLYKQQRGKK